MHKSRAAWVMAVLVMVLPVVPGMVLGKPRAQSAPDEDRPAAVAERESTPTGGGEAAPEYAPVVGPQKIDAGHDVVIDLPPGFLYLDPPQAKKLMERNGNLWNDDLLGVIARPEASWLVTIRYTEDGYVKDDEAAKLDNDAILKAIRDGTDEANKEREQRGFKALRVLGWSEPPRYERGRHHLVWAMRAKTDDSPEETINFNTRVLGRKGFVALNLIDGADTIEASKPVAATLLAATTFKAGARYEDFNGKTDKVAEYGLAALILGGAGVGALKLVKVGLLAKFGGKLIALIIALKKAIVLVAVAAFAFLKRLFGRKKPQAGAATAAAAEAAPDPAPPAAESRAAEGGPDGQAGA